MERRMRGTLDHLVSWLNASSTLQLAMPEMTRESPRVQPLNPA